jgi:hypothetical protein
MDLNNTEFTNFQKLRYFGLAMPTGENNEWILTRAGLEFLQGRRKISRFVFTQNARVIMQSVERVFISEVKDCIEFHIAWQAQATEPNLFDYMGDSK